MVCAVLKTDAGSVSLARTYGVCLFNTECTALKATLPGGIACYDVDGNQI
jgi:hypothetical protein